MCGGGEGVLPTLRVFLAPWYTAEKMIRVFCKRMERKFNLRPHSYIAKNCKVVNFIILKHI